MMTESEPESFHYPKMDQLQAKVACPAISFMSTVRVPEFLYIFYILFEFLDHRKGILGVWFNNDVGRSDVGLLACLY